MPMCGPNCMGILNPTARSTTYKQTVMEPTGLAGNVGIVSQSGSVCSRPATRPSPERWIISNISSTIPPRR